MDKAVRYEYGCEKRGRGRNTYLPLGGEVAIPGGDAEDESIEVNELVGLYNWVIGLGWCVHFGEYLLREGLCNSESGRTCISALHGLVVCE